LNVSFAPSDIASSGDHEVRSSEVENGAVARSSQLVSHW